MDGVNHLLRNTMLVSMLFLMPASSLAQQTRYRMEDIPDENRIDVREAHQLMKNSESVFLFTGDYEQYLEAHPSGFRQFSPARLDEFEDIFPDKKARIILFNRYQQYQLLKVFYALKSMGYTSLFIMRGGINEWKQDGLPVNYGNRVTYQSNTYKFDGYSYDDYTIYKESDGEWKSIAKFTDPTFSLLKKYTDLASVKKKIGGNRDEHDLFERISGLEMSLNAPVIHNGKFWFGMSIYNGEGSYGYGGIGFYDPNKNRFGILRHPALVNCSTREIHFEKNAIMIATIGNHELSNGICNGVVVLYLDSFNAVSLLPPVDEALLWHKDEGFLPAAKYYDKSIKEILEDERFIQNSSIPGWDKETRIDIKNKGLESYMVSKYEQEVKARIHAIEHPVTLLDTTIVLNRKNQQIRVQSSAWNDFGIYTGTKDLGKWQRVRLHSQSGFSLYPVDGETIYFYPPVEFYRQRFKNHKHYEGATSGKRIISNSDLYHYVITIKDFNLSSYEHKTEGKIPIFKIPIFNEVTLHANISQLRN